LLVELNIKNFAIIDELNLRFSPCFNVLTGETGAGKSIIIDAVSILLGGRAESEYIRAGTEESQVEGIFHLDEAAQAAILPLLKEDGLEGEDDETLILAREIRHSGRNICRVNGRAVTLGTLERIAQRLVDIHGQSEHLSLLRVREHVNLLDRYAGLWPLRSQVADKVSALRQVQRELQELLRDERELARRADLLEYQVQEISAARLEVGEEEELEAERNRLANAERLTEWTDEAYCALGEGEEGQASAIDLLGLVVRNLTSLEKIDPSLAEQRRVAEEVSYQLEDLVQSLRAYRDQIEFDPFRLGQVEERLDLIHSLKRKYGDSIEEVLAFGQTAQRELEAITHSEERVEELQAEEDRLLHEIGDLAAQLSAQRREADDRLSAAIEAELADLSMERARFGVSIEQGEDADGVWVGDKRYAFDSTGIDRVEFLVAPNVGEPLKPMAKIASGGETSRLMLALKAVLSAADETPTLIFDEIDQGIGGRTGGVVGYKLWSLSPKHQVLCVTHLPQLAGYGDTHYKVDKKVVGERTIAHVHELDMDGRLEELAQMLGTVTEVTRQGAQEILEEVKKSKKEPLG
jgi:DNA repair protein RecN (Recombination protein N)